jgi:uncharacterized damage-inducible protein DinB
MPINDALLPEYDREMALTRRVIEQITDAHLAWRPEEKSVTVARLATHVAELPVWSLSILEQSSFDAESYPDHRDEASSCAAILELFDRNVAAARAGLAVRTDGEYLARWTFRREGRSVFSLPKAAVIRTMVLNHIIHHRGELTVYLRLLGIPVPALYGPSEGDGV